MINLFESRISSQKSMHDYSKNIEPMQNIVHTSNDYQRMKSQPGTTTQILNKHSINVNIFENEKVSENNPQSRHLKQ